MTFRAASKQYPIAGAIWVLILVESLSWDGHAMDYDLEVVYTGEVGAVISGGIEKGNRYIDNLDLMLGVDLTDSWAFGPGRIFAYGLYNNAATLSDEFVGDLQVVSNIDAPEALRLYELWYEFGGEFWSVRSGLYDLNSEFDASETGSFFHNSSHGIGADIGQTGRNGPSIFPVTSLAVRGRYQYENLEIRAAVFDGVPGDPNDPSSNKVSLQRDDGVLLIVETDWSVGNEWRIWSGIWGYSADFERLDDAGSSNDNRGAYIGTEFRTNVAGKTASWFGRYGVANGELNNIKAYFGTGLVIDSPIGNRPDDQFGLALASARAGSPYRKLLDLNGMDAGRWELNWEVTYSALINDWLVLQPNIQYVHNPSVARSIEDALVVGVRFEVLWSATW